MQASSGRSFHPTAWRDIIGGLARARTWSLMAARDIASRYRRSVLGPFWITLTLAVFALGIGLLYGQIFRQPFREYMTFLICGLSSWYLIQAFFVEGSGMVIEASGLLSNVRLSVSFLAARVVLRGLIVYGHNLIAAVAVLLVVGDGLSPAVALLPPAVALAALFGFGVALVLGPLSARYRDLPQVVSAVMQLALFLSPVIWPPDLIEGRQTLMDFNPLYHFLELLREPLLGKVAAPVHWLGASAATAVAVALGLLTTVATRKRLFYWL